MSLRKNSTHSDKPARKRLPTVPIYFPVFDPYVETWIDMRFPGHSFVHEDRSFILFPAGVVGRVLCRSMSSLMAWERSGKLPAPLFEIVGTRARRWYSEKQIRMMHRHQIAILGDNPSRAKNQFQDHDAFFAAIRADWEIDFQ